MAAIHRDVRSTPDVNHPDVNHQGEET